MGDTFDCTFDFVLILATKGARWVTPFSLVDLTYDWKPSVLILTGKRN